MKNELALVALLTFLFVLPIASASSITRSFSKTSVSPGETVSVTLDVAVTGGESYYIIDDSVPQGWTILNPDPETQAGHVKLVVIQGATSTTYTYDVRAPQSEGSYAFSGKYMFEGMATEGSIGGGQTVTVAAQPKYEAILLPLIIVSALVLSFVIYRIINGKYGR